METAINLVLAHMQPILSCEQLKRLIEALRFALSAKQEPHTDLLRLFLTAKEVEGCSPRTIAYYESTIRHMADAVAKPFTQVESSDLREYLAEYESKRNVGKVTNARDLAIVDMLATTGMRVGGLVGLDIDDINLQGRECIVTGKGNKQRPVYFDARAKLHLQAYLDTRDDDCPALFVSLILRLHGRHFQRHEDAAW